jgi:hypothetical protein
MAEGEVEDSTVVDFDPRGVEVVDDDGDGFLTLMKGSADLSTCRQRKLDFSMCSSGLCFIHGKGVGFQFDHMIGHVIDLAYLSVRGM